MSDWIATPKGAYIAEDGGYLMCVDRGMSSQVYAYNTVCRDGTYNRAGDGYPDAKSAMVAAEKAMREHRDIRAGVEHLEVLRLSKIVDDAWAATGVASTVRGLTDLADVIQTIRKERDEWSVLAKNNAERLTNVRKALLDSKQD